MVGCSAVGCKSRSEKGFRMYGFPSTADAERRKRWVAKLSRKDLTFTMNYNNYKLCEAHFEEDQFCFTRQGKLRLVKDAVPTIFSHRRPVKRRKPPSQRHANLVALRNEENLARVRSDHSYYTTKAEPVIRNPAPEQKENQEMDFLSLLKMHAIDIVQVDFSQQSVTVRESPGQQPADSSKGAKGSGVSKLGQTASRLSQSERPSEETAPLDFPPSPGASPCQSPERETEPGGSMTQVELRPAPVGLEAEHADLLTAASIKFLQDLVNTFDQEVDQVLTLRVSRKAHLDMTGELPEFRDVGPSVRGEEGPSVRTDPLWRVSPVPPRLTRRHVDVGDLAPCDTQRLLLALRSPAQGLQIDFDDGNCPTYRNQIKGLHNVYKFVNGLFPEAPPIKKAPVLMLRPRAWNMVEHNMMVNGKEVPGPLFDFALLMFHCGKKLFEQESGPYFYLSKVESYHEARLWNNIFVWTQDKLGLPQGSIKATVLIENVLAAFQMEEILFELKEHSAGLNCGIWDYSASFINKFGHRGSFLLPDRSKYVNMQKRFLRCYMDLLVQTCHHRGALATGGMAATLMPHDTHSATYRTLLDTVTRLKLLEIKAGVDGFMVYDLALIEPMQKTAGKIIGAGQLPSLQSMYEQTALRQAQKILFQTHTHGDNQLDQCRDDVTVTAEDLLTMPSGGVTLDGLQYNITVGILFIDAWLSGKGHFFFRGQVEDSATAEISRSQVWQWIRHQTRLEDDGQKVTRALVSDLTVKVINNLLEVTHKHSVRDVQRLTTAANMFLEVVQRRDFPEFLTTYLNLDHTFLSSQAGGRDPGDPSEPPPNLSTQPHPNQQDPAKPPKTLTRKRQKPRSKL